ncbi:MAG: hypothetical protein KIS76_18575 [Pyrinomonadaceae bacterium]|nr:hypothetical protein [Pyrinomonadaceae bacterium]
MCTTFALETFRAPILFQKSANSEKDLKQEPEKTGLGRIRCPKCAWNPKKESRWYCMPAGPPEFFLNGCGAVWNTFETGGRCPGCGHQWRWTTCLSCGKDSLHKDWYPEIPN